MRGQDEFTRRAIQGLPIDNVPVVDSHMHVGECRGFPAIGYDDIELLLNQMDGLGVNVGAISSTVACIGGDHSGNDMVIETVQRHPGRFIGYVSVNSSYREEIEPELVRCYESGLRAIKIHDCIGKKYDHENYRTVYDFAAERGLPILAHTWGDDLDQLEQSFGDYPGVNWLLGHSGSNQPEKYVKAAKEHDNVFLEICWSKAPRGMIEYFVDEGLQEKVLYGSDCVFMNQCQQIGRVLFADVAPEVKALILGGNARRVFGDAPAEL